MHTAAAPALPLPSRPGPSGPAPTRPGPSRAGQSTPGPSGHPPTGAIPRLPSLRERWAPALCLAVVLADQASKAAQPPGTFIVNTGGAAILPAALGDALWKSPTLGAVCDTVDAVLLLGAMSLSRKLRTIRHRIAATAVLAGLLSNLADRLGASSLFHVGLPRGSIDWIPVPLWPTARTNLADVVIALGALAFAYQPARTAMHALRTRIGGTGSVAASSPAVSEHAAAAPGADSAGGTRTRGGMGGTRRTRGTVHAGRSLSAVAVVLGVASWTMFWQANRYAPVPTRPHVLHVSRAGGTLIAAPAVDRVCDPAGPIPLVLQRQAGSLRGHRRTAIPGAAVATPRSRRVRGHTVRSCAAAGRWGRSTSSRHICERDQRDGAVGRGEDLADHGGVVG